MKKREAGDLEGAKQESLILAGSHGPSAALLPALMAQFRRSYPSVTVKLYVGNSREIEKLFLRSKLDLAVVTNPTMARSFHLEPYRQEQLTAFVAVNHPLANKKSIKASELRDILLIVRLGGPGQTRTGEELNALGKKGMKLKTPMGCQSPESLKEAVRHGAGVGVLYREAIKREIARGEFRVVNLAGLNLTGRSYIVYSKERPLSTNARHFLTLLRRSRSESHSPKSILKRATAPAWSYAKLS